MDSPDFPIDEAYLIGGWLASAFWGMYTIHFFTAAANNILQVPLLVSSFSGLYHSFLSARKGMSLLLASSV